MFATDSKVVQLGKYNVQQGQSSVSGLSSGAFMTVQLHLAHSASFVGAGIIAGGPFRCAETFPGAAPVAEDAFIQNSLYICLNPLVPQTAPNAEHLARLARQTAAAGEIDPVEHLADDRVYIFTGSKDEVVFSDTVARTKRFYELLGIKAEHIDYDDTVPAGHSIITRNPEDSPLGTNQPPYINQGDFIQSHRVLGHIHGKLNPPSERPSGRLVRFDQREFLDFLDDDDKNARRDSMSDYGYAYIPKAVEDGEPARVHIALHGCKQGYNYVEYTNGRRDTQNAPPYGNRYVTTTGYNELADSNNFIILYPQAEGTDNGYTQNPEGCWDWWGYSSANAQRPDYYSRNAIQIRAIHDMLKRLGG
ncbi:extracellular catalytic domain type 2 short-chain-length polyhydroxyalkanoate depolymerase [Jeongeupia chitinilytica]|uniref:Depolymerase n=1 Tax=Jeongeupia chitinilytica TaxID=1041641 RepID=A0ABQ3GZK1_9NEIS|nr:poly(3-hydroxybutyrate) depolymerase [Jeongeupia chitinilytica]GHD62195.1 depolymerase [Jeongeupia chitinilytica]